ncbi:MAG: IS110 family transposase [Candidatus Dormibacteria bacterium]
MEHGTIRFGSVDWASQGHAAGIVDAEGTSLDEFEVAHSDAGLNELCRRFRRAGVRRVAIERPDGPIVDALIRANLEVVVVSSRAVKALRTRYGLAGNKSDRSDAFVLADCLRTDGHRWASLQPDAAQTLALRAAVRTRKDLVATRIATANQLRSHLQLVFPGAVGLFAEIDSTISLDFLERFPTATKANWLSEKRLAAWLVANAYSGRITAAELRRRLQSAPAGLHGAAAAAQAAVTMALVRVLRALLAGIAGLEAQIREQLALHPDGFIFQSLPRSGCVRAAALLAEIGDCRARFPSPECLAALAGAVPSTRRSGKHHAVTFRRACDKKLRDALIDFAQDSVRGNEWANRLYRQHRAKGHTHPHASRVLARAWIYVIWRCWQDRTPYDPVRHGALQAILPAA